MLDDGAVPDRKELGGRLAKGAVSLREPLEPRKRTEPEVHLPRDGDDGRLQTARIIVELRIDVAVESRPVRCDKRSSRQHESFAWIGDREIRPWLHGGFVLPLIAL